MTKLKADKKRKMPKTFLFPNLSANGLENIMPMIIKIIPPALNKLLAEVGASFGHSNVPKPKPVMKLFKLLIKLLNPISSRNTAIAASSR